MERSSLCTDDRMPSRVGHHGGTRPRATGDLTATTMPHHEPAQMRAGAARDRERPGAQAPTVEVPRIRPRDPVARAVLVSLETALSRIRSTEAEARRGDVEGIHRLRTTTRRLRSELRAFRDLVDPDWIGPLEGEMKWLAGLLGSVRDLDVLTARLREAADEEELPPESLAPLFADLMSRHARASHELRGALQGDRYRDLHRGARASHRPSFARHGELHALPQGVAAARGRRLATAQEVRPRTPAGRSRRGLPRGPQARQARPIHGRDGRPRPIRGRRQGRRGGSSGG